MQLNAIGEPSDIPVVAPYCDQPVRRINRVAAYLARYGRAIAVGTDHNASAEFASKPGGAFVADNTETLSFSQIRSSTVKPSTQVVAAARAWLNKNSSKTRRRITHPNTKSRLRARSRSISTSMCFALPNSIFRKRTPGRSTIASSSCRSRRIEIALPEIASPQILSRGKRLLSSSRILKPNRAAKARSPRPLVRRLR